MYRYDVIWMEWGHVKKKWTPAELSYIKRIDPRGDVERLSKHFKFRDVIYSLISKLDIVLDMLKKFQNRRDSVEKMCICRTHNI